MIYHSSQLDHADLTGKRVVVIGSGASGVESAELAVHKMAESVHVLAREDKWLIPRNAGFDILLSLKPYGAETRLSWIPEWFIRKFRKRSLPTHFSPCALPIFFCS
jgi:dimethylaniline monooxygenase (N-oxide forming)